MYTSDTKNLKKQILFYLIGIIGCALFSTIYETFSHGVISYYMILSFLIPLVFCIIQLIISKSKKNQTKLEIDLYNSGVITLTLGSIIQGVLEIYGTTNVKVYTYLVVGILLILISIFFNYMKNVLSWRHN